MSVEYFFAYQVLQKTLYFGYLICFLVLYAFYAILHIRIFYKCVQIRSLVMRIYRHDHSDKVWNRIWKYT